MIVRVLGSAAGGGFPQLNCNCRNCNGVRASAPGFQARTQTSVAVSRNRTSWTLLGASPDLRHQAAAVPELRPAVHEGTRSSPIEAVVLTDAEVDGIAGLLSLREGFTFDLFATPRVLEIIDSNSIFDVLARTSVRRVPLANHQASVTPSGVEIEPFNVPGKAHRRSADNAWQNGDTIGLKVRDPDTDAAFFYVPACAAVEASLAKRLRGAELLLFDGTLYTDDEMIAQGLSNKRGLDMGHISMCGPEGSIAALSSLGIRRRVFVHINNSNPVLDETSSQRAEVERSGWEIAFDGMEISL